MKLINGDCIEELKKLSDKSIDFFYLDLPYGQTGCKWDNKIDLKILWEELKRLAKNDRTPFFFSCTTKFGFEIYQSAPKGWFRWDLVHRKNKSVGFLNCYKLPMRKHEMVYCFAKKCPNYDVSSHKEKKIINFTCHTDREDSNLYRLKEKKGEKLKKNIFKQPLPTSDITPNTWCEIDIDKGINHRTAKPIKLMEFLLTYWTKEGQTICDPTAGSGSMGVACKNMNRQFIGIEKDMEIYNVMCERINHH